MIVEESNSIGRKVFGVSSRIIVILIIIVIVFMDTFDKDTTTGFTINNYLQNKHANREQEFTPIEGMVPLGR